MGKSLAEYKRKTAVEQLYEMSKNLRADIEARVIVETAAAQLEKLIRLEAK